MIYEYCIKYETNFICCQEHDEPACVVSFLQTYYRKYAFNGTDVALIFKWIDQLSNLKVRILSEMSHCAYCWYLHFKIVLYFTYSYNHHLNLKYQ